MPDSAADPLPIDPLQIPFDAELRLPGSKSEANRAIVVAALSAGETRIQNATPCDDVKYLVAGLQTMGFDLSWQDESKGSLCVRGGLPPSAVHGSAKPREIYCGNAGTAIRFLTSVAVLVPGEWLLCGDRHMAQRPIADLVQGWRSLGVTISAETGCPPVRVTGGLTQGGSAGLDAAKSSQFLSSMMLVGWRLRGGLEISISDQLASEGYVGLTQEVLRRFGVASEVESGQARVPETPGEAPRVFAVEGDWSAAGGFFALAALSNSEFRGSNLRADSSQSDRAVLKQLEALATPGALEIDVSDTPDQLMNLALVAAHRAEPTRFVGAANLRLKECDRLAVTVRELGRAGLDIEGEPDGLLVKGGGVTQSVNLDPEEDHRFAILGGILGSLTQGVRVQSPTCVSKSYPNYFADLKFVTRQSRPLVLVGMRACGKSTLAPRIAEALALEWIDSDAVFEDQVGGISEQVSLLGWPAFRAAEEIIINKALRPRVILATGGGAVESELTRSRLAEQSVVIWLNEDLETILTRLRSDDDSRPPLTEAEFEVEVKSTLDRRRPFYEDVADLVLPPGLSMNEQTELVIEKLRRLCTW